jgi:hypothetical protein
VVRLLPLSPNLNALAECFVRSLKQESLRKMIFFGDGSLRRVLAGCGVAECAVTSTLL